MVLKGVSMVKLEKKKTPYRLALEVRPQLLYNKNKITTYK